MAQPVVVQTGLIGWHKRSMEELGLQPVLCRTDEKDDGSYGLKPVPGTTGRTVEYGVWVEPPSAKFDRLAFRIPPDAVVLDVDTKPGGSNGVETLARMETDLGVLPPTQRLTSRGPDQGSGRLLFRVPAGVPVNMMEEWIKATYGGGLDILHIAHRFSMAPGDHNPNTGGSEVHCYSPDNRPVDMWHVNVWPPLPDEWIEALADYAAENALAKVGGSVVTTARGNGMIANTLDAARQHDAQEGNGFRGLMLRTAKTLGGFVGTLHTEEEAEEKLTDLVREIWGAEPDRDDLALIRSGLGYGMEEPFEIDDSSDFGKDEEPDGGPAPIDDIELPDADPETVRKHLKDLVSREAAKRIFKAARAAEDLPDGETGWDTEDLGAALDGLLGFAPEPEFGLRADGHGLFYAGKTHSIYGDPGSGKSLVAQYECARVLLDGGRVLYVDYEDSVGGLVGRLRSLGVPDDMIRARFTYIRPRGALIGPAKTAFDKVLRTPYEFSVVDGVTSSVRLEGLDNFVDSDVDLWHDTILLPIAERTGAAVVSVDHVVKNPETRGRHPYGSQRKLGSLTGSAYSYFAHPLPSRGKLGTGTLFCTKDRPGGVTPNCADMSGADGGKAAVITFDALDVDAPTKIRVDAPEPGQSADQQRSEKMAALRDRIVETLKDREMSGRELEKLIGGNTRDCRAALAELKEEGAVTNMGSDARPKFTSGSDFLDDPIVDDLL